LTVWQPPPPYSPELRDLPETTVAPGEGDDVSSKEDDAKEEIQSSVVNGMVQETGKERRRMSHRKETK